MALFNVLFDIAAKTTNIEASITRVERRFGDLGNTAKRIGEAMGLAFSAQKIFASLDAALERSDSIKKFSQSAGIATEALSKLEFAASQVGLQNDQLETGLKKFNVSVNNAAHGVAASEAAFKALGISVLDAHGHVKDMHALLLEVAQRFSETADGEGKVAVATTLLGRAGELLIPFLNKGADGLKELGDQAQKAGLVIGGVTADAAEKLHEQLGVLKATVTQGLANAILNDLMPALTALGNSFTDASTGASGLQSIAYTIADALKVVATIGLAVIDTFKAIAGNLGEIGDIASAVAHGEFAKIAVIRAKFQADSLAAEALYQQRYAAIWSKGADDILQEITISSKKLRTVIQFDPSGAGSKKATADAIRALEDLAKVKLLNLDLTIRQGEAIMAEADVEEAASKKIADRTILLQQIDSKQRLNHLKETMQENDALVAEIVRGFDRMNEIATQAAQGLESAFEQFFYDPMKQGLSGLLSGFIDILRRMVAQAAAAKLMQALFGGSQDAGSGFFGAILRGIFGGLAGGTAGAAGGAGAGGGYATYGGPQAGGGSVKGGMAYLVGEQGPELFLPGRSGSIVPNSKLGGDSITINHVTNVDARGAQEGQAAQLAEVLKRNNAAVKSDIIEGLRRRKYRI